MNQTKKILLTFDYEPFLGAKSGTAELCMLKPTDALRTIMNRYNAKAVFFVDMLYLLNLKKYSELNSNFAAITNQLKTLNAEGHYIFPHIHPHWLDAVYISKKKEFSLIDFSRYSLAKFQKSNVKSLFEDSINCLRDIDISYPKWGYRAGGWCIQPFSTFKDIFISENIGFDFSVLPGYKNDNIDQAFDFSMIMKNNPYFFSDAVEKPDDKGLFIEFPISTIQFTQVTKIKDKIVRKYLWETGDKAWGNGLSAKTAELKFNLNNQEMISVELLNRAKFGGYKKYIKNNDYMHWISHPKMFTKHGLKMFDDFLKFSTNNFNLIFDFHEMLPSAKTQ